MKKKKKTGPKTKVEKDRSMQKFYRSCPWDKWWDDFLTARDPDGSLTYPTAWSFCKANGNDRWEHQVMYWCIGPKPTRLDSNGQEADMPVKWLGDWANMRNDSFNYSDKKINNLRRVLEQHENALEAARGVATVALEWVAKADRWAKQLDGIFKDQLVAPAASLDQNAKRIRTFIGLQRLIRDFQFDALHEYLRCHGVGVDDISMLAQMAAVGAQAALKGVQTGSHLVQDAQESPTLREMLRTFQEKANVYGLDMPEADLAKPVEAERVEEEQPLEAAS